MQTTLIKYIAIANICPNVIIILPILFGFLDNERTGLYTGFASGIIFDAFYANILGVNAFIFMMAGFVSGILGRIFSVTEMIVPMFMIAVTDFTYGFVNYCLYFLLHKRLDISYYFNRIMMPELVYTLFVSIIIYRLFLIRVLKEQTEVKEEGALDKYVV